VQTNNKAVLLLSLSLLASSAANAGSLSVELGNGIKPGEHLMVAVYDQKDSWLKKSLRGVREAAPAQLDQRGSHTLNIDELPAGRYAVAVYVDKNANGKLDRGMFGIPSEPYGFSNGGGSFGPPSYDDAAFDLSAGATAIQIKLN